MSATTRNIVADCATGDGSQLTISTDVQDEEIALTFQIKPGADDMTPTVRIGIDALAELIGFQNLESARYADEWVTEDNEDNEDNDEAEIF